MTDTYLAVVGNRTGDAERLQADADSLGSVSSSLHTLLDGDGSTADVCPLGILEADALGFLTHQVGVYTCLVANLVGLFNTIDPVLFQSGQYLIHTALLTLKLYFSYHSSVLLILYVGQ